VTQPAVNVITQNVGENIRREQARDLAANVVQAVFRLIKAATLHAIDNQAVVRQVEDTVSVVQDFGHRSGYNASILFTRGSVFVSGQLLKANRSVYEGALELAEILERCGYSEINVSRDVRPNDLATFATAVAEGLRSGRALPERPAPHIRLRKVGDAVLRRETAIDRVDDETQAIVRTYATAIVIMRRFYDDLRRGRYALRQGVKRIAQRLVDLSAGETPAFLGVTALRNQNHDDAGRAVNTAILSLAMARQITSDVVQLGRIGMAALLFDTARPRLSGVAGREGDGIIPELSEQQEAEVPAGTAVVLTALGLVNEPSVMRTVIAYEGHWARRQGALGPLYRGLRQPTLQARIVAVARAFNDLLTPLPGQAPLAADEAVARLEQEFTDPAERTVLRLLVGALGLFPTGTLVQLSTGEVALVVQTPSHPARYSQPRVRLVLDAAGGPIGRPLEIDLAARPRPGEPARHIRRVVATSDDPQAAAMRAHAGGQDTSPGSTRGAVAMPGDDAHLRDRAIAQGAQGAAGAAAVRARSPTGVRPSTVPPPAPINMRSESPTVRPGRRTAVPEPPLLAAPALPRNIEPFHPAASYSSGPPAEALRAAQPEAPAAPPPRPPLPTWPEASAPPLAAGEEADVHAQATRPTWAESTPSLGDLPLELEEDEVPQSELPGGGLLQLPNVTPTAEGGLQRTPLVHLLVYMLDRRLTGTTCFVDPDRFVHGIYFVDGVPSKVWTGTMVAPLDRVILDLGLLDEQALRNSLKEISKKRVLHGRHLVTKGLIDRETLLTVLRHQLVRKLVALFDLPPATTYAYFDGLNLLEGYGGPELLECEPLAVIMAGVRMRADNPVVDATLERIAHRPLGLHLQAEMKRFQLHRDEAAVVDLLRTRRMTLPELCSAGVAQERVVRLTVYALAITRHLDLGVPGRGPVGLGRERPASPLIEVVPVAIREREGREGQRPAGRAAPPSSPGTPAPRTTRSGPGAVEEAAARVRAAREVGGRPAPVVTIVGGGGGGGGGAGADDEPSPPPNRRTGMPAAAGAPEGVAMPRSPELRSPSSPRTLASPGVRPTAPQPQARPAARETERPAPDRGAMPPAAPAAPVAAAPAPAAPAAPAGGVDLAARRAEIEARSAAVDHDDFFTLLGVTQDVAPERIRTAYFALAKQWHPDRQPADLQDLKSQVARVFARISEAYQTLSDAGRRAEYAASLQEKAESRAAEEEKVVRAFDAALEFQKAEILLKKRDLAGAEALAQRALNADPEEPEYLTLYVWIQALRRGDPAPGQESAGAAAGRYDDLIQQLDAVLEKEPRYERALFYRASLLKRSGQADKAIRDFQLVAELNPKNIDAIREVRLHEMRKRGAPEPQPPQGGGGGGAGGPGLLGKIFKR